MHYQHRFHAGNFADVFKHALLCLLVEGLSRKDKPWFYLETHAGAARYDLAGPEAARTGEWQDGIARLWGAPAPAPLARYLGLVRGHNPGPALRWYPGSPQFVRALARPQDRLALCEQVPEVCAALREQLCDDPRVAVHLRDGYEASALLPPREKRGLVLVDPPFERPDEFEAIDRFLDDALARFAGGVVAVWYPHKQRFAADRWLRRVQRRGVPAVNALLDHGAPAAGQMRACGLVVLNPPWQFAEAARPLLDALVPALAQGREARAVLDVLVAEPGGAARPATAPGPRPR